MATSCGALILAGGVSRRMGLDKALLPIPIGGRPAIQRIVLAACRVADPLDVVVVGKPGLYEGLGLAVVPDILPGQGPLVGLYSGLRQSEQEWNLVIGCEFPLVRAAVLIHLRNLAYRDYDAVVPVPQPGYAQPLCAVYHQRVAAVAEAVLAKGSKRLADLRDRLKILYVSREELLANDPDLRTFMAINSSADYERVIALAEEEQRERSK